MNNENKNIIAVFDADFLSFYVCHNKKDSGEKSLNDCINMCDDFIKNILMATKANYYVGYLTTGKCFRYNINPDYKANRKYLNMPKYMAEIKERLIGVYNFKSQENYEADDLCLSFKKQNPEYDCIIVSPDKDLLGICEKSFNPRKMVFNYHTKEEIVENFWRSMVCGDTADNIKGIPGKGPKYFEKIIERAKNIDIHTSYICFFKELILDEYCEYFGEYEGIKEFYKNYISLKIKDDVILEKININVVN